MIFKVFSYNLHKGIGPFRQKFMLDEVKEALDQWHPDAVFLQELPDHFPRHSKNGNYDSPLEQMADQLWPHHAYGTNAVYAEGRHGNALLSKFPFSFWENIDISTNLIERRGLLHGVITIPHHIEQLHLICCHSNVIGSLGNRQLKKIVQRIHSHVPDNHPLILAGDFNDWHSLARITFQRELGLDEVFWSRNQRRPKTFPSWLPLFSLDRIFFRGVDIVQTSVLTSTYWKKLSDHLPLFAELRIH